MSDSIAWLKQRTEEVQAKVEKKVASRPAELFLRGMSEFKRAMPNQIARSSLFAPIARGHRKQLIETLLVTRSDAVMSYSGEQLDEADADITLQLFFEAKNQPLGLPVAVNRAALLRALGRQANVSQYQWLMRRMKALTEATLIAEAKRSDGTRKYSVGKTDAFHIVQNFGYDSATKTYSFTLDSRWIVLFGNDEYALLDWEKRKQIGRGQDMAKSLQLLVATSSDPIQRYLLEWLKEKMQYRGRMRDFKKALARACRELERLNIIANYKVEISTKGKQQLSIWMTVSA
ncbi:MAG: plasmid replication initiator TrfA [Comamonas thiooxydans]